MLEFLKKHRLKIIIVVICIVLILAFRSLWIIITSIICMSGAGILEGLNKIEKGKKENEKKINNIDNNNIDDNGTIK